MKLPLIIEGILFTLFGLYSLIDPTVIERLFGYKLIYGINQPMFTTEGKIILFNVTAVGCATVLKTLIGYGSLLAGMAIAVVGVHLKNDLLC